MTNDLLKELHFRLISYSLVFWLTCLPCCKGSAYNVSIPWNPCESYGHFSKFNYTIPDAHQRGHPFLRAAVRSVANDPEDLAERSWKPLCASQIRKSGSIDRIEIVLSIEYSSANGVIQQGSVDSLTSSLLYELHSWISQPDIATLVPLMNYPMGTYPGYLRQTPDFSPSLCIPFYNSIFSQLPQPLDRRQVAIGVKPMQCLLFIANLSNTKRLGQPDCAPSRLARTIWPWDYYLVDDNFHVFINGGSDTDGVWWLGRSEYRRLFGVRTKNLANELGIQLLGQDGFYCTLESSCPGPSDCNSCGSRTTLGTAIPHTNAVYRSSWGYILLQAFSVFNAQLENNYKALQGAAINAALETFNIGEFYPHSDAEIRLEGVLSGLTLGLSIFSAIIPLVTEGAKVLSEAAEVFGAISTYIGEGLGESKDLLATQKTFASSITNIYNGLVAQLDSVGNALLSGQPIAGIRIEDILRNGTWATTPQLTSVPTLEKNLRTEIFARSINSLWKTYSSNKMWLTFTLLSGNDTCLHDQTGPQDMKLCRDGGVYYAYNFVEDGDGEGHVDYPWGADKLESLGLSKDMILQASADTYLLAKRVGMNDSSVNIFNISDKAITKHFLDFGSTEILGGFSKPGRYPGSWTLPVCNMSTWGNQWNWNYNDNNHHSFSHPPCLCGEGGKETATWATAAGLKDFKTFRSRCQENLQFNFRWPDGITKVDLGFGKPIERFF